MTDSPKHPPLRPLRPESSLNAAKLEKMRRLTTEALRVSLLPDYRIVSKLDRMELYWMDIIGSTFFANEA